MPGHGSPAGRHGGPDRRSQSGQGEGDGQTSSVETAYRAEEAPSIEHAVRSADIVCTTTHASQPVVLRDWLQPGTHVNSVGYNTEGEGEIDGETLHDTLVVVESRDSALAPPPAGAIELRLAIERGFVTPDEIGVELGELVAGSRTGRTADEQITVYKSVGVAVKDAAGPR